jgi:hypothetical protein
LALRPSTRATDAHCGARAHPKVIQERLGRSCIKVTLDTYGHLFPNLDEALARGLDDLGRHSAASSPPALAKMPALAVRR